MTAASPASGEVAASPASQAAAPAASNTSPTEGASRPTAQDEQGERLALDQPRGRLGFFLQGMFVLTLFAAIYTISTKSGWLDRVPGMMLFAIGVLAIAAVRSLRRETLMRVELGASSLTVQRLGGRVSEVDLGELLLVRKDVGPDEELAYFLHFSGDRHLRLRAPSLEQPQLLQVFVERLAERAGMAWTGTHAKRA